MKNLAGTGRIFTKFDIWVFENLSRKFKFRYIETRMTDILHEDWCTFMIISHSVIFRMRKVSDKLWRENQNTILSSITCFRKSCLLWDNVENIVDADRPQMTTRRMNIACWITKATNTLSEYVTIIVFPLQQWPHERVSMLHYTYSACLVFAYHWLNII